MSLRKAWQWAAATLALTVVVGCSSFNTPVNPSSNNHNQTTTPTTLTTSPSSSTPSSSPSSSSTSPASASSIVYRNTQYGFSVTLPETWQGYSIVSAPWEGLTEGGQSGQTIVETGPIVSIRNPEWTVKNPRQDIPIMVFTIAQWNSLQQGVFHIGAAPVGPSELGRNNTYVFALPARYNFAFLPGYQEVEKILAGKPLKTTPTRQLHPDSTESLIFNMVIFSELGKVVNCDFAVKTNTIEDVAKAWGKADKIDWVATAKGRYATYASHNVVFGINKGDQIFEIRSSASILKGLTLSKVKEVLGTPAYDAKVNGQEIIGYKTNSDYKLEMVFPQPTNVKPNPVMDHYNVLYPDGTVNSMADDPGRQW